MPGQVVGGGDIRPCDLGQRLDQRLALGRRGDVATVDQDVALSVERPAPLAEDLGFALQPREIQGVVADPDRRIAAMAYKMNRTQPAA